LKNLPGPIGRVIIWYWFDLEERLLEGIGAGVGGKELGLQKRNLIRGFPFLQTTIIIGWDYQLIWEV